MIFRYRPDSPEVLRGISLRIEPGEIIGMAGPSGSGKRRVVKLVQRLHVPERGRVLINGLDLALADSSSLRPQIGMVLQESILFNRTIREDIALAEPGADMERVVQVAEIAGAHEFIGELDPRHGSDCGNQDRQAAGDGIVPLATNSVRLRKPAGTMRPRVLQDRPAVRGFLGC